MAEEKNVPAWVTNTVSEFMDLATAHKMSPLEHAGSGDIESESFRIEGDWSHLFVVSKTVVSGRGRVPDRFFVTAAFSFRSRRGEGATVVFGRTQDDIWYAKSAVVDKEFPLALEVNDLVNLLGVTPDPVDMEIAQNLGFPHAAFTVFRGPEIIRSMLLKAIRITCLRVQIIKIANEQPQQEAEK